MGGTRPGALHVLARLLLLQPLLWSHSDAVLICREEERSALSGFKKSLFNESRCFSDDGNGPRKMVSWKDEEGEGGDCCNWSGIKCDEEHVTGLDLSESCLSGRIDSDARVFNLFHLQELSLAYNSLDGSPFPTALRCLRRLTRLNLSSSGFAGEVVPELTKLRNLFSLDLSRNGAMNVSSLEELLQSLNKLEELDLTQVRVSDGKVPRSLGNMTFLRSVVLYGCGLSGRFPDSVFELPRLEYLDLSWNHGLMGRLTGFHRGSALKSLRLSQTNFSGELPVWLGNLSSLAEIDIASCGFWGEIPSSMGDLTKLEYLNLASNNFRGRIPASFGNLISLSTLDLHGNRLTGEIPSKLGNLISLVDLDISVNELAGKIPPSLGNITQLRSLFLHSNQLSGEIPSSLMQLPELIQLGLAFNMFRGNVPPEIGNLTELIFLGLANNTFHGPLPDTIFRLRNLKILSLRSNHLNGMPRFDKNVSEQTIWYLDLSFNDIEGMLPIPPSSVSFFLISNNRLSGEIPPSICEQENIRALDLSDNRLDGGLPWCFGNFSASLSALSLSGNNFSGQIPEFYQEQCELITMDLSSNSFEGALPRSIVNCRMLGYVNIGKNKIMDTFPAWLGSLPSLKVLMLHSNKFHGVMKVPTIGSRFPSMKVLTLSENKMEGRLPAGYFARWRAMKHFSPDEDAYPDSYLRTITITIIDKGMEREFGKTLESFKLLDLTSNNFSGTIPKTIGHDLQNLHTLNLSNNGLSGPIPLSLSNFNRLEVLDLLRNKLSGPIPKELKQITSLNYFNVSRNNLSGPIPMGNQFSTFENTSYTGNLGLCGYPLTRKCGDPLESPASPSYEKSSLALGMVWIATLVGLAGGLVMGVVLEQAFGNDVLGWAMRKLQKYRPVPL